MDKFTLTVIVTFGTVTCAKPDKEPQLQIFEIRQTREDKDRRGDELRIDYQYYDPDEHDLKNRIEYLYRANYPRKYKNRHADIVTENLVNKLKRLVLSKDNNINGNDNDDYIFKYKNLKTDNEFEDNSKTPLVLVAHKDVLYHIIPQNQQRRQNRLQFALRSINSEKDIEDRTAPPRTSVRYDYEY